MSKIYSEKAFRALIERERTRCDRNSHEFSLVVFTLRENTRSNGSESGLFAVLEKRVRSSDEMGWLGERQIGVFLPDTPTIGAFRFAGGVCSMIDSSAPPAPRFKVYTYPSQNFPGGGNGHGGGSGNGKYRQLTFEDLAGNGRMEQVDASSAPVEDISEIAYRPTPFWKRVLDVMGALIFLLVFSPFMAGLALLIKLVSPGPVFFKQERIGAFGKPFMMWKFRTMQVNTDTSGHKDHVKALIKGDKGNGSKEKMVKLDEIKGKKDCRLIPFGKILRKTALDELPQLFNVLRGEMSLVGPRPCIRYEYEEYKLWQTRRFDTIPGMTGLWQVCGKNTTTFNEMMRLDINYARRLSPWLDLKIIFLTIPAILGQLRQ